MQINGLVMGKYRIEKLINNGSFASVFRAKEELTNRIVAIKALPKSVYPSGRLRYLMTELSAMTLNWGHENIVSIHTVEPGEDEYIAYIVMEYIDGSTLHERMAAESFSPSRAVNIALDICRGLTAVHAQNIIHRDIKPQNILLTSEGTAKLGDFGVACILEATDDIAATVTGTRKYMAPEQYDGEYDYRVDLYSLGLVLYEMLTGQFPFRGRNHDEIKIKKLDAVIAFDHEVPEELHGFLQRVLHRNVNSRYQSATEMYQDLDAIRATWYAKTVREELTQSPNTDMINEKLSRTREDLRLSPDLARWIELEIHYQHRIEEERQKRHQLEQETSACYERAIDYIHQHNPVDALRELKEVHSHYSAEFELSNQVKKIFRSLIDSFTIVKTPSRANEIVRLVELLSATEVEKLKTWFDKRSLPNLVDQSHDIPDSTGSDLEDDGSDLPLAHTTDSSPTQPLLAESVLRSLHEKTKYPHERAAAQICRTAENYTRQKNKRARSEYRKLAEFYLQSATHFIDTDDWEAAADCYARARLANVAAKRAGSARTMANKAGDCYAKLAESLSRQQLWEEAATHCVLSANHYKHGESNGSAEEGWSNATIYYLNAAEDACSAGDVERVEAYCQKIFAIAENIQRPSKAAAAARRLMSEIEESIATPSQVNVQDPERYPPKSVAMHNDISPVSQWQARR